MTPLSKIALTVTAAAGMVFSSGCATKNHVKRELAPVVDHVNELDAMTARNMHDLQDADARAQQGITSVGAKADAADQKAAAADQRANEAQSLASNARSGIDALGTTVANLDNYRPVAEAAIHFGFDQSTLTKRAKQALDELAQEVPNTKGYIVELQGGTDSVGPKDYNYQLSQKRTASVVQYLASKHGIPAHKIYVIGLGEDKTAGSNNTRSGRAENRRVEVRLMTNTGDQQPAGETVSQNR